MFVYPTAYQKQKRISYITNSTSSANLTNYSLTIGSAISAGTIIISIHAGTTGIGARTCNTMTLAGQSCTFIARINDSNSDTELWYLKLPTALAVNSTLAINMSSNCESMAAIIYRAQGVLSTPKFSATTKLSISSTLNFGTIDNLGTGNLIVGFSYYNGGSTTGTWNYPTENVETGYDAGAKGLTAASARTTTASQNVTVTYTIATLLLGVVAIVR